MAAATDGSGAARPSWRRVIGIEIDDVSAKERLIASIGGLLAILAVLLVSRRLVGLEGAAMLVGSMGASAVLLFAVPHGQLSQPWAVVGGQVLSAVVGVTCARWIEPFELAAACAVGISIGVMHTAKCVHPPGGATALAAVAGGPAVADLGYSFVWRPVLLNTATILVIALVFNAWFPWRRYPAAVGRRPVPVLAGPSGEPAVVHVVPTREQVRDAMRSLDVFVDVTEDDLLRLHELLSRPPG